LPISHALASSMGGIRTTGDLVARMQLGQKMRLPQAKRYVAEKLGIGIRDPTDSTLMCALREELDVGG
jgi:dimethylamine--corrinoid protein Co-methyltransferase